MISNNNLIQHPTVFYGEGYGEVIRDVELVSFDIWETLITQTTSFALRRNEYLAKELLPKSLHGDIGTEMVKIAARTANDLVDAIQEVHGIQVNTEDRLKILVKQLKVMMRIMGNNQGYVVNPINKAKLWVMATHIQQLFLSNPPRLINPAAVKLLKDIRMEVPVVFLSNTGMITGKTMRKVLTQLDLVADYCSFSDEIGYAKPHSAMFESIKCIPGITDLQNIVHIGDNYGADVVGAVNAGITAIHLSKGSTYSHPDLDNPPGWQLPGQAITIGTLNSLLYVIKLKSRTLV